MNQKKEDFLKDKVLDQAQLGAIEEMINQSNIYVIKCINLVLKFEIIKKAYGSFIIFTLIIIEIICTIIYCKDDINSINKYILGITNKFINSLSLLKPYSIKSRKSIKYKPEIIPIETINKFKILDEQNIMNKEFVNKNNENRLITRRILLERKKQIKNN